MSATMHSRFVRLVCCLLLSLLCSPGDDARAELPDHLKSASLAWVCVTDASLADAYAPLAAHRQAQGLAAVVLSLDEVLFWAPTATDTVAALRWLADKAAREWGAGYLLLGGSHAVLPAPLHRLDFAYADYVSPIDAYYACLDGDWDADGDGLFAEVGDDDADPTVSLAVGRLPLDTAAEVAAAVAKIIAYEQRGDPGAERALFVSSLMDVNWQPGDPYPTPWLADAMGLRARVLELRPDLLAGELYQDGDAVDPLANRLNPGSLADSLAARPHDLVFMQLNGISDRWQLAGSVTIESEGFADLAGCGHVFLGSMVSAGVADSREPSILAYLLGLPDGGAVAVSAPTGTGYFYPMYTYQESFWAHLLDDATARLGDAHRAALADFVMEMSPDSPMYSSYWYQSLQGDPATLLHPQLSAVDGPPAAPAGVRLSASPNPFNPTTSLRFEVPGTAGGMQPVRLEILDLRGRLVATLLDRELPPGPCVVTWQPRLASGVYLARVTVAGLSSAIKVTLLD